MTVNISIDAEIDRVRLTQQNAHPPSPANGYVHAYVISGSPHGGLFIKDSAGREIGPFITGSPASSPGGGALVLLESHTASASASLVFATRNATGQSGNSIQSDYDDYLLEIVDLVVATDNVDLNMQYSADSGSTYETGGNYYTGIIVVANNGATGSGGANATTAFQLALGVDNASDRSAHASMHLRNMLSTTLSKNIYGTVMYTNQTQVVGGIAQGLLLVSGTAYNAFKVFASSGNIASGSVRLYGIAKS